VNEKGFSLVPLRLYFKNGKVKMIIALAKGKHKYDKRETIRRRDEQRDVDRQYKANR
jgi:SsrA-binding protein